MVAAQTGNIGHDVSGELSCEIIGRHVLVVMVLMMVLCLTKLGRWFCLRAIIAIEAMMMMIIIIIPFITLFSLSHSLISLR